jgi:hypothetical protein
MKGLTLTQARNIEDVLMEMESAVQHARSTMANQTCTFNLRTENIAEFCETIREVLG